MVTVYCNLLNFRFLHIIMHLFHLTELLEDTKIYQSIKEIAALLVGVYMMVLIAQYE